MSEFINSCIHTHILIHKLWTHAPTNPTKQANGGNVHKFILTSKLQLLLTFSLKAAVNKETVVHWHFTIIISFQFSVLQQHTHAGNVLYPWATLGLSRPKAIDPWPAETGLSHDVRKPGRFPPAVPPGSHQMSPSVEPFCPATDEVGL